MQHPLIELRKLLAPKGVSSSGRVVKVENGLVHVATGRGVVMAEKRDATDYRPGDRAVLKGGELAGKYRDEGDVPVFFL